MLDENFLKNPPNKYRPHPFWSWNEKLDVDTTKKQIDEMKNVGIGGFFMHARGGLQTEYMGEEWFSNIKASVQYAKEQGMLAWGYDENGWPSGFASGKVCEKCDEFCQKLLFCEKTVEPVTTVTTLSNVVIKNCNYHTYYKINPYYVDVLNNDAVKCFIENTHEIYKAQLGKDFEDMVGFFTDEPQICGSQIGWSDSLSEAYNSAYNEKLEDLLPSVFYKIGDYKKIRYRFWITVREVFCNSFLGQISEWCHRNGLRLTGHMMLENRMEEQITSNSSVMSMYEYFDIPGMDWIAKKPSDALIPLQVSSVAHQLGKKQTISETFAACGWNLTFEEMRRIYEWQMVHGITMLCQHLQSYSIRGIRKRDYPASLFIQQPWWNEYKNFNDLVSRIGMLLSEGETDFDVLVLHPQESAWLEFNGSDNGKIKFYDTKLVQLLNTLDEHHIFYDLGDERIMKQHGEVKENNFVVGKQSYKTVIVPPSLCYSENTYSLLKTFQENGGSLIFCEDIPTFIEGERTDKLSLLAKNPGTNISKIADEIPKSKEEFKIDYLTDGKLIATKRKFKDSNMYYVVNSTDEIVTAKITAKGKSVKWFDAETGKMKLIPYNFCGNTVSLDITMDGNKSCILFFYDEPEKSVNNQKLNKSTNLCLDGSWEVRKATPNSMILDFCECYFDNELIGEKVPISDIQELACEKLKPVDITMNFGFNIDSMKFSKLNLMIETPEIFEVFVNGQEQKKVIIGSLYDNCFKLMDIKDSVIIGKNILTLKTHFAQTEQFYKDFKHAMEFESEKNKLTYGQEIEAVYIVGDFSVLSKKPFYSIPGNALGTDGQFYISDSVISVDNGNLVMQGFPFFSGKMTLKKQVTIRKDDMCNSVICFNKKASNIINVTVNGKRVKSILWKPYSVDISEFLHDGKNDIEIELISGLRNTFGPFHLKSGEPDCTGPNAFFHISKIWANGKNEDWTDSYSFVPFGLYL